MNPRITNTRKEARQRKARVALRDVRKPGERFRWLTGFRVMDKLYLISSFGRVFEVYEYPSGEDKGRFEPLFVADKRLVRVRIFRNNGRSKAYAVAGLGCQALSAAPASWSATGPSGRQYRKLPGGKSCLAEENTPAVIFYASTKENAMATRKAAPRRRRASAKKAPEAPKTPVPEAQTASAPDDPTPVAPEAPASLPEPEAGVSEAQTASAPEASGPSKGAENAESADTNSSDAEVSEIADDTGAAGNTDEEALADNPDDIDDGIGDDTAESDPSQDDVLAKVESYHYIPVYDTPRYQVRDVESSEWEGVRRLVFSHDGHLIGTEKLASIICDRWAADPRPAPKSPELMGVQSCNVAESKKHNRWIAWSTADHTGQYAGMTHYRIGYVAGSTTPAVILGYVESGYRVAQIDDAQVLAEAFVELSETERAEKVRAGQEGTA